MWSFRMPPFLILALVLSFSEANEYYVRPTEPFNVSCPGQPCLTLSQYINDSGHYFKSNTVFKFISGTHSIDSPVIIQDMQNVSLIWERSDNATALPQLISQSILCGCDWEQYVITGCAQCAAILFQNVSCATIEGIEVSRQTPPTNALLWNGISFISSSKVSVRNVSVVGSVPAGIYIENSSIIAVEFSNVLKCGIVFYNTSNGSIWKTLVQASKSFGIEIYYSENTSIAEVTVADSAGIYIASSSIITVEFSNVLNCGILFYNICNGSIWKTSVKASKSVGIEIYYSENISIAEVNVTDTESSDIHVHDIFYNKNASVAEVTVTDSESHDIYNIYYENTSIAEIEVTVGNPAGIYIDSSSIIAVEFSNVLNCGIVFHNTSNSSIWKTLVEASKSVHMGIEIYLSKNTSIAEVTVADSKSCDIYVASSVHLVATNITIISLWNKTTVHDAVYLINTTEITLINVTTKCLFHALSTVASENMANYQCYESGAVIINATTTSILNASVSFAKQGIIVFLSTLTTIESSHMAYTMEKGVAIYQSELTTIKHTFVIHSLKLGISFFNSANDHLSHLFINESIYGLYFSASSDLVVENTAILEASEVGITLLGTRNSTIKNTLVKGSEHQTKHTPNFNSTWLRNNYETFLQITFGKCKWGLTANNSSRSLIINTTFERVMQGIVIESSTYTTLEGAKVEGTRKSITDTLHFNQNGLTLEDTSSTIVKWSNLTQCNMVIRNSTATIVVFTSVSAIEVSNSININISHNIIRDTSITCPQTAGIWLKGVINATLADSYIDMTSTLRAVLLDRANFTTITGVSLKAGSGIMVFLSSNTFLGNVTAVSTICGINAEYSTETVVTDVTIRGLLPITVEACKNTRIEKLTLLLPDSAFTEISFILSNYTVLRGVDVNYPTSQRGLRFLIGSAMEVNISDISIMYGGQIQFGQGGEMDISQSVNVMINNVFFVDFNNRQCTGDVCYRQNHTVAPTSILGQPAVVFLQSCSGVIFENCSFLNNSATALKVVDSSLTFSGMVNFTSNRATRGAAIILSQRSYMTVSDNTLVIFKDNYATLTGGAIHLDGYRDQVYKFYDTNYTSGSSFHNATAHTYLIYSYVLHSTTLDSKKLGFYNGNYYHCFLEAGTSQKSLHFINNSAGQGGDVLYGGNLEMECVTQNHACTESCLTLFKTISNISPNNSLSMISSDPSRVCLCNTQEQPDCNIVSGNYSVYPGQSVSLSAVVVGQDFGTVQGSVFVQFIDQSSDWSTHRLGIGQIIQEASQLHCNKLSYTIFSSTYGETTLVLSASYREQFYYVSSEEVIEARETYNKPGPGFQGESHAIYDNILLEFFVTLNFTFLPCPPGFELDSTTMKCDCNDLLQRASDITCNVEDQTIQHTGSVWIGPLLMTEDNHTNTIQDVVVVQYCPLDYCTSKPVTMSVNFSQPDPQCNYNRSGTLCGGCQPGLSLALGSVKCLHCSNEYLALLIPFALAGVVLVFVIKALDFTVSFGPVNGLTLYANIIETNKSILMPHQRSNPLTIFISWLNLNLGIETCFVDGFTAYWKTWLQFVFPIYVWVLAGCIIISARYSRRMAKLMGNNSVPVLATLFLMSYTKLFHTIVTVLSYSVLQSPNGQKAVWSADGNLDYLGPRHTPLFVVAVAVLLFVWLPYTLLLFLGQWLHKCNCRLINQLLIRMKPFLDAHYGPLRDRHHYWFGALLLFRAAVLLMSALLPADSSSIKVFSITTSAAILLFLAVADHRVYRGTVPTLSEINFLINLILLTQAKLFTTNTGGSQSTASYTLVGVALVQFIGLIVFKIYNILKTTQACVKLRQCLHRNRPNDDDDWEIYELIAMQREEDGSMEENDQDDPEREETMPTYGV